MSPDFIFQCSKLTERRDKQLTEAVLDYDIMRLIIN